jgi:two-component system, chemotaxis family, sensor kinase CheA
MEGSNKSKEGTDSKSTLLVLGTGSNRRLALPTSQVARLEKIPVDAIEYADNREVVQYRGKILPLFRLASVLGIDDTSEPLDGLLNVVVYTENTRSYGLVVNRIIDIVETIVDVSQSRLREGLLGSSIIQDHVTDLIDLPAISKKLTV